MNFKKEKSAGNPRKSKIKKFRDLKHKRKNRKEAEEAEMASIKERCENIDTSEVKKFSDLPISQKTLRGLQESGFKEPTEIQRESLRFSLRGLDVLGAAKTGSGKTLAFIIPILEVLNREKWTINDGLGALVITPTRELAYQIFEALRNVGRYHDFSAGLVIGGKDLKFERKRMYACNIVICTPGRLLQHMDENPLFTCDNMKILVLDEADRCLDMGFQQTMNSIIENLPPVRQTLLFSATQTTSVRDLARLSLKDPMYISVHEHAKYSTPEGLQQSYVVCELHEKVSMLWSFLKNHLKMKILVFLSTCKQVKYHYQAFCRMKPGISLLALYGTLHQMRRMKIYEEFCRKQRAVLFATDIAARGLDFPEVNWVVQLDCPEDADTYIHRAGRTARYHRGGESLLVLLPSEEEGMVEQLEAKRIPINKIRINPKKLQSPSRKMEAMLARDPELKASAQRAFVQYVKSVYLMKNKKVFDVHALDTDAYAASLGLAIPPRIRFLKKAEKLREQQQGEAEMPLKMKESDEEDNEDAPPGIEIKEEDDDDDDGVGAGNERVQNRVGFNFAQDDSGDESDADLLKMKRKNHEIDIPVKIEENVPTKTKKISKAALVRKLINKKIIPNTKTVFDEETGEAVLDRKRDKVSELAREYENEDVGGIDIEKARLVLKEEDKFDKQLFREKVKSKRREMKLKLKRSKGESKKAEDEEDEEDVEGNAEEEEEEEEEDIEDSDSGPDLSWLPDPDKVFGKKEAGADDSDAADMSSEISDAESNAESEEDIPQLIPLKRKGHKLEDNRKRRKVEEEEEDEPLASLTADEELALHFLKAR